MPSSVLPIRHFMRDAHLIFTVLQHGKPLKCCTKHAFYNCFLSGKILQDPFSKLKHPEHDPGTPILTQFGLIRRLNQCEYNIKTENRLVSQNRNIAG